MDVTGPPVKGSTRKCSDRGQPPTVSENESGNVLGDCPGALDEMGLEDALGAIIEERQGQIYASGDLPNEQDPDLDSDAEIAKSLETIASCVDWQCAAPDPAVESRSEAALLWASPSTVVELWRIWTAMSDIVASGAEVMATGPCRLCEKMGVEPVNLCGLCGFE